MSDSGSHYSILRGTNDIIDEFFGVKASPELARYATRATHINPELQRMTGDALKMLLALHEAIATNWDRRSYRRTTPSTQNWRCEAQTQYAQHRKGWEVKLEREIVSAMGTQKWHNAVPTSSGMCGSNDDKHRNIDLVFADSAEEFIFYELKWDADTPVFAAIEILFRGVLNVFTRLHKIEMGYRAAISPMLTAPTVHLRVLAPNTYFSGRGVDLGWLEDRLNIGLKKYVLHFEDAKVALDFAFESFPDKLQPPFNSREAIRDAMSQRAAAYPLRQGNRDANAC